MQLSRRTVLAAGLASLARPAVAAPLLVAGCRDAMLKPLGFPDVWAAANAVGAEGLEVTVDDKFGLPLLFHPQRTYSVATPEGMQQLTADLKAAGQKISSFCVASRYDSRPDFEVDFAAKLGHISDQMGVRAMRIDVVSYKIPPAEFLPSAIAAMKKLMSATEGVKVRYGIENHGPCGNDPAYMKPLLESGDPKRLGVTLDTANLYWFGHPLTKVYELIETYAPRAVHTHCKNIAYPADQREVKRPMGWQYSKYEAPVDKGDIDFARVIKILRDANYTGDLCVENETLGRIPEADRKPTLAAEIAHLKKLRNG